MNREQIGTIEISRQRIYPIDPFARDEAVRTEVLVEPGTYPVFRSGGITHYWQMTGTINGHHRRLGDGLFMLGPDEPTDDEVTFYSPRFGPDEWAEMLADMAQPGSALTYHEGQQ